MVYNSKSIIPDRIKRLLPRGVIRPLRKEALPVANLWYACWRALEQLYIHNKITQHPAHMMYILLLESRVTGFLSVYCTRPDGVTAENYITYQQRINAYLKDLDSPEENCPLDPGWVGTRYFIKNMRVFAEESDVFRKNFYSQFTTARSKFVNFQKQSRPIICILEEYHPYRNHLQGKNRIC